jgi:hypothetical protein
MSYSDGLNTTVDIGQDDGSQQGERGDPKPEYPVILSAVRCRIVPTSGTERDRFPQRDSSITHRVLFEPGTRLDNSHRLFHTDPISNRVQTLQVKAAYDPHNMGRSYLALCEEIVP